MKLRSKVLSSIGFAGLLLPMWSQAAITWTTAPACSAQSKSVTCEWAAANDAGDPVDNYDVAVLQDGIAMPNRIFNGAMESDTIVYSIRYYTRSKMEC
ncbi:hypothetical protein [Francisella sciaenopsi]|uniref:Uncharacterized protein n=1 Tax=Francisella sciaenopsi TaxID=3055034 RepID=A0ABQ6PFR8_9GAMM